MCNCGNKRNSYSNVGKNPLKEPEYSMIPHTKIFSDSHFEYSGKSALTVKGNITGKIYRFEFTGDVRLIDYRDASAMYAVPVLKKVKR